MFKLFGYTLIALNGVLCVVCLTGNPAFPFPFDRFQTPVPGVIFGISFFVSVTILIRAASRRSR